MKLQDKVVAVTGGTQGIGRGIAEAALTEGAKVSLNGRSAEKGDKALAEFGVGDRAAFFAGDVTVQADVENFIEQTVATFGRIDVLVNNAGGAKDLQPTVDLSDEEWTLVMNWNLNSNFWATRRALKHMLPNQYGRIINISSVEGKHGKPVFTAY
ncbi:SDR family NAD(P)-dependent oxidoreductase, partial [Rhodococcus sp. EPR-279]